MDTIVRSFGDIQPGEYFLAGGKGRALAQLYQAGYPVPDGFIIFPGAFRDEQIIPDAWPQIEHHLGCLRAGTKGTTSFAVRSSAYSEDSVRASFAGEFETVLDVHTDQAIRAAIHTVRQSRHAERARAYSKAKGLGATHDMAVVVQCLVRADISGVLFTCDPVSADRMRMTGNYIYGFGEELVSGEAEPFTFSFSRPKGIYQGPAEFKKYARKLFKLARKVEKDMGCPQDIEWSLQDGRLHLLQSRPITTLIGHNPLTGEWNDSLTGDFLWSNANLSEAAPDVLTPFSWSIWEIFHSETRMVEGDVPVVGNICGRSYANLSFGISMYVAMGKDLEGAKRELQDSLGLIPDGVTIPLVPFDRLPFLLDFIPKLIRRMRLARKLEAEMPEFLATSPGWCRRGQQEIEGITQMADLVGYWTDRLYPNYLKACWMIRISGKRAFGHYSQLHRKLAGLVGEEDANTLMTNLSTEEELLASLGLVVGLARIARGEMSRQAFIEHYGHRGPHECELSTPRPVEDPHWLDQQLEQMDLASIDVQALLARRRAAYQQVWNRFQAQHPRKVKSFQRQLEQAAAAARAREACRSEFTRVAGAIRSFALRAGDLSDLGDGVFFFSIHELLDLLRGEETVKAHIPARRATHDSYCSLPTFPTLVRGHFDPFEWALDPNRRSDLFDSQAPLASGEVESISGFPGAAGRVEGIVRRLDSVEEGYRLSPGEILVTATTNVGWTPLFPRAAAIITDVGAPLSHAAIVARELGIPAVVGCGQATMRLRDGDRVRVDGGRGLVEILED